MTPTQHAHYLQLRSARERESFASDLRIAETNADGTPDPYARPLAKLRHAENIRLSSIDAEQLAEMSRHRLNVLEALHTSSIAAVTPAESDCYVNPPDPYQPHLDRLRRNERLS